MKQLTALIRKDLLLLLKAESQVVSTLMFALVLAAVAAFSFRISGFGPEKTALLIPGILWIIFLFISVVALNQNMALEREGGALRAVLLTGVDPILVFHAKMSALMLFLFIVQTVVITAEGLLLGVDLGPAFTGLLLIALLLTLGIASLGTVLSAIAVVSRAREVLLPLLLFPLCIPLFAIALQLHRELLESGSISLAGVAGVLLLSFDAVAVAVSTVLFEYVVSE